jgi:hypothetical protein
MIERPRVCSERRRKTIKAGSRLVAALFTMAGTLGLAPAAHAVTYIPANNLGDATVSATSPGNNYGERKTLVAKSTGAVRNSLGYVTFGFSPSAVPTGTPYTGGTLTVYAARGGPVCVYRANRAFDELTLTWENRPLYGSVFEYPENVGHPTIACATLVKGVNVIDVTGDIIGYLHSPSNIPTYVIESQGGRIVISSAEGQYAPSLVYQVG